MNPRIMIVGDSRGHDDEGMKKVGRSVAGALRDRSVSAAFVDVRTVFRNGSKLGTPKVIHFMVGPTWRTFCAAKLLRYRFGNRPKVVMSFIHPEWSFLASAAFRLFRPDAVIAQSEEWLDYCSAHVLTYSFPLAGVDLERFAPVSIATKLAIRRALGLPTDKRIILHVGHFQSGRNLVAFLNLVREDRLVVIIGSTTSGADSSIVARLRGSGVKVIHRYVPDIEKYYQAADCYVFPTMDPAACIQIPLSVIEALACGVPVVASKFGGLPYYFRGGTRQLRFSESEREFETNVSASLKVGSSNVDTDRRIDLNRFSWAAVAAALDKAYGDLAHG